jgi:hypothetical protein
MSYKLPIGATPTHTFELPFEVATIKAAEIVYKQHGEIILTKALESCNCDINILTLRLTQEETFLFDENSTVAMQMRVLTKDGEVIPSDPIILVPCKCLSGKVLS